MAWLVVRFAHDVGDSRELLLTKAFYERNDALVYVRNLLFEINIIVQSDGCEILQ